MYRLRYPGTQLLRLHKALDRYIMTYVDTTWEFAVNANILFLLQNKVSRSVQRTATRAAQCCQVTVKSLIRHELKEVTSRIHTKSRRCKFSKNSIG
jgi:hypothetical protein